MGINTFSNIRQSYALANACQVVAGEAISQNDLVEIHAVDGKGYKVKNIACSTTPTITYGASVSSTATGMVKGQTQFGLSLDSQPAYSDGFQCNIDSNRNFFVAGNCVIGNLGIQVTKISPSGVILDKKQFDTTISCLNHYLLKLSNGNFAVVYYTAGEIKYLIVDAELNTIKAPTIFSETATNSLTLCAIALSGGGFAAFYQQTTNPLLTRYCTYDNTGTLVQAATTIWTRTGTSSASQMYKMAQLSNGNIAIAAYSGNTVSSYGLYHGVITIAGTSVLAFTQLDATQTGTCSPEIAVMNGYYAISKPNGINHLTWVFNNAGTIQGSMITDNSTHINTYPIKLLSDGSYFWLIWSNSMTSKRTLSKITSSGVVLYKNDINVGSWADNINAFIENGVITIATITSTMYMYQVTTSTGRLLHTGATSFAPSFSANTTNRMGLLPCSGGAFMWVAYPGTNADMYSGIVKYDNTAIVGVATSDANIGATVTCYQNAGAYPINQVYGQGGVVFDMSATTQLYGNKGTLMNNSVVLKGM